VKEKITLKEKEKTQNANKYKFNYIVGDVENKLKNITIEPLFKKYK
jgi:hypothetical protein